MALEATTTAAVEAIDDLARSSYRRARAAGQEFSDVAVAVRSLHTVLKHLRVEAEDHDSLLNAQHPQGNDYAHQLGTIVRDCNFTLRQLNMIFEDHDRQGAMGSNSAERPALTGDWEQNPMAPIIAQLTNQKNSIDMFLDTIQLHNPAKTHPLLPGTDTTQLENTKEKLDGVALRLFRRRVAGSSTGRNTDEELWQQFCTELTHEGFASDVLHQNKEVLRAYIRELDSNGFFEHGRLPVIRGSLPSSGDNHAAGPSSTTGLPPTASILPPPSPGGDMSPKEVYHPSIENEKFSLDVKDARIMPGHPEPQYPVHVSHPPQQEPQQRSQALMLPSLYNQDTSLSYDPYSSFDSDTEEVDRMSGQLALISTRDLMALDRREEEYIAARMGGLHLSPQLPPPQYSVSPGTSPSGRLLAAPQPLQPPANHQALSLSPASQALSHSPRYIPPLPTYSALTPPPAYGSSPIGHSQHLASSFPGQPPNMPARYSRLAPDSYGQEIPLDAKWTKIRRSLVSPIVLEQAGLRYEARPDFVAVLGVLSHSDIENFAKRSARIRSARSQSYHDKRPYNEKQHSHLYGAKHTRRSGSSSGSETEDLWDESDTTEDEKDGQKAFNRDRYVPPSHKDDEKGPGDEKGTKVYPFIVSPPSNEGKASPASTVQPKPILKNKNENHVRFEADGPVEITPAEAAKEKEREERRERRRDKERERDRDRDRDRDQDDDRDKDRERRRRRDRYREQGRERDKDGRRRRDRDHPRDRDRDHERDRDHHGGGSGSSSSRRHARDSTRDGGRDRREERSREDRSDDRNAKKNALRETFGAVGIGGAAATLLSVLTEAAAGL